MDEHTPPTGAAVPDTREAAEAALSEVLARTAEAFGMLQQLAPVLPAALLHPIPGQLADVVKADPGQAEAIARAFVEAFKAVGNVPAAASQPDARPASSQS